MAATVPSCSSGYAVRIRSIRDRRVPVKRPKHGTGGAWQESSFQPLAVRLTFFTLRASGIAESLSSVPNMAQAGHGKSCYFSHLQFG